MEIFHHGKTRDKIAAPLGISGRTLEKAQAIVEAAEQEPDRFGHLVAEMDRPHGLSKAYYELRALAVALVDAGLITAVEQDDRRALAEALSKVVEIITADLSLVALRVPPPHS